MAIGGTKFESVVWKVYLIMVGLNGSRPCCWFQSTLQMKKDFGRSLKKFGVPMRDGKKFR
jgi:hypothetical protein